MEQKDGRQRVVIENIYPELQEGRFPVKRVAGESVEVYADIFADGHDLISAVVMYRHEKQRKWREVRMEELGNDRWKGRFPVVREGIYFYTVSGWVDHARSWLHDVRAKADDGQSIEVELQMGLLHLEEALGRAIGSYKEELQGYIDLISQEGRQAEIVQALHDERLEELLRRFSEKRFPTTYPRFLRVLTERRKALFSAWYELFPRSCSPDPARPGTLRDVEALLPRIEQLGFDVLYLPPIHPIGHSHRKGKNNSTTAVEGDPGSPWAIGNEEGGHKSIDPALGTFDDFASLIESAEKHGIEIALDIAFQCSPDHPYVKENPQWFKWRPDGSVQYAENPPKKYQDVLPFNFETGDWKNLWKELKSIFEFWIDKGVRIFRVDNPHTKPFPFWEWMMKELKSRNDDIIYLAEAFTRPRIMQRLGRLTFTQSYTYYTWRNNKWEIKDYVEELTQTEMKEYFRPNFWPNTPDINPWKLQSPNEAAYMMQLFMAATLSSNYGVYGPVYEFMEAAPVSGKEEYLNSEKYEIRHWDWAHETRVSELMRDINVIRRNNKALQNTSNIEFCETQNDQLLAYYKWDDSESNRLLMVVNLDKDHPQSGLVRLPLERLGGEHGDKFVMLDLMTGNQYVWESEWNFVLLDPAHYPFHLFRIEKL